MEVYIIIGIGITLITLLLIILITTYNKFQWSIIKLNKGETTISNALEKKYHLLLRYIDFLKNNISVKYIFYLYK